DGVAYVSTVAFCTPSMYTFAIPDHSSRYPIQLTPVPLNVNVARAPLCMARAAEPPLCATLVFVLQLPPEYATLALFCSTRVGVVVLGGGVGPEDGAVALIKSTIKVSIRFEHPNDVSAPSVPSQ